MCDLADFLIGKANQIEISCHISFFSEFKKQKNQHSLAIRIARTAGSKLSPLHFPLRRTTCVPPVLASHHMEAFSTVGGGFVTSTQISPRKELSRFIMRH